MNLDLDIRKPLGFSLHRGVLFLRMTNCGNNYSIHGVRQLVMELIPNHWIIGPLFKEDEADNPDIGPFATPEEAATTLKLLAD